MVNKTRENYKQILLDGMFSFFSIHLSHKLADDKREAISQQPTNLGSLAIRKCFMNEDTKYKFNKKE